MLCENVANATWAAYGLGRFGTGYVFCREERIVQILLPAVNLPEPNHLLPEGKDEFATWCARRLEQAFQPGGNGVSCSDLPIVWPKSGSFIRRVWELCREIPRGSTVTYGELARRADSPKAVRAVGNAMATNPLPLVIPCHRVLTAGNKVGNYGGGADMKRWLLGCEGAL